MISSLCVSATRSFDDCFLLLTFFSWCFQRRNRAIRSASRSDFVLGPRDRFMRWRESEYLPFFPAFQYLTILFFINFSDAIVRYEGQVSSWFHAVEENRVLDGFFLGF